MFYVPYQPYENWSHFVSTAELRPQSCALLVGNGFNKAVSSSMGACAAKRFDESENLMEAIEHGSVLGTLNDNQRSVLRAFVRELVEQDKLLTYESLQDILKNEILHSIAVASSRTDDLRKITELLPFALIEMIVNAVQNKEFVSQLYSSSKYLHNTFALHKTNVFRMIFTINYDPIPLFVGSLHFRFRKDGFGKEKISLPSEDNKVIKVRAWEENSVDYQIAYLHGAVMLLEYPLDGDTRIGRITYKDNKRPIAEQAIELINRRRFPLCVAASSSKSKIAIINKYTYLKHCLQLLKTNGLPLVIFGASLLDIDTHIIDAIVESPCSKIYFALHNPGDSESYNTIKRILSLIEKRDCRRFASSAKAEELQIWFFNSELLGMD